MAKQLWSNWARNQQCMPTSIRRPTSEDELVAIVKEAATRDLRVKVVGAGHSFTPIALTDGVLVDLSGYGQVLGHDPLKRQVTVQAGIQLRTLCDELNARGLAMENMGDINEQSLAGATSTATHGTGARFRNLSSQIVAFRLVTADGSVLECSEEENSEVFHCGRVGLGALGIVSTITLQAVDAFRLRAVEEPQRVDELLEDLDGFFNDSDHAEFFWVPHTGWALTKRNTRTSDPAEPRTRWERFRDETLVQNVAFGAACRFGRRFPTLVPRLSTMVPSTGRTEYTERSDHVFTSPRHVRFVEMEYAIAVESVGEALTRVRDLVRRLGTPISFPVEVRCVASDDIPLSTAYGRATGYVAVHAYWGTPFDAYFAGVERIMNDYGGRPHWGKLHFQSAEILAGRYPEWSRFLEVRSRLDPEGRFTNPYLDRVLGALR